MARKHRPKVPSVTYFRVGGEDFAVLGIPTPATLPRSLTRAEREVVALLLAGRSNAEIGRARGTSVRTVANQVASILRKLAIGSRSGLIARLSAWNALGAPND